MSYRRLFVFVEGADDERLFDRVLKPALESRYDHVAFWAYAREKTEKIERFLRSVRAMGADYLFVADAHRAPCATARTQKITTRLSQTDPDRIVVVVVEIEGWYAAGVDDTACAELDFPSLPDTDALTKEQFDELIPRRFDSRIDFMAELLKRFSIPVAETKNRSFHYFARTFLR